MDTIILTAHIIIAVFLIGVILLQRSEGGALGIGGGGGGGFMGGRSAASALTRTTVALAVGFFATSFALGFLAEPRTQNTDSVVERVSDGRPAPAAPAGEETESPAGEQPAEPAGTPAPPAPSQPESDEAPAPPEPQ
jgi:preprotein translocase subunit SecG